MKTPPASRRTGKTKSPTARAQPLHVFIGYGDVPAFRGATTAVCNAMRSAGRNVQLHPLLWRFEQLASTHWCDRATHAAMEADVVVLASSTPAALTPDIEQWISSFLQRMSGRPATLVVITSPNDAWTISIEPSVAKPARAVRVEPDTRQPLVA